MKILYWAYHLVSVILKGLGKKWSPWEIAEFIRIAVGKSLGKACPLILPSLSSSNPILMYLWGVVHDTRQALVTFHSVYRLY